MNREDALLFRSRWEEVARIDREELRRASPEEKLRRAAACLRLARGLGLPERAEDDPGVAEVRERWVRLKAGRA